MFWNKKPSLKKALRQEKKGDRFFAKENFAKAFNAYEESWQSYPDRAEIYPKLIQSFEKLNRKWTQEDFELTLSWTMRQQELENPEIKQIHEKFSPEYQAVQRLIQQFLVTPTEIEEQNLRKKISSHGDLAVLALLDFLQNIKTSAKDNMQDSSESITEELEDLL